MGDSGDQPGGAGLPSAGEHRLVLHRYALHQREDEGPGELRGRGPGRIAGGEILFSDPARPGETVDLAKLPRNGEQYRHIRGGRISIIFQEPMTALSPLHTIGNQVGEALRLHHGTGRDETRARTRDMLRLVGFPDPGRALDTYPFELSGGLRQRAMIAMALICRPALLIADEPTTALDVTIQAQILDLMQKLQEQRGMGMLFVTHNLGVVAEIAHRVAVMYAGRIVESGPVAEVFRNPRHPYTMGLLKSMPRLGTAVAMKRAGAKLNAIPGVVPSLADMPPGCAFAPRCAFAIDACRAAVPAIEAVTDRHGTRCIRWQEIAA